MPLLQTEFRLCREIQPVCLSAQLQLIKSHTTASACLPCNLYVNRFLFHSALRPTRSLRCARSNPAHKHTLLATSSCSTMHHQSCALFVSTLLAPFQGPARQPHRALTLARCRPGTRFSTPYLCPQPEARSLLSGSPWFSAGLVVLPRCGSFLPLLLEVSTAPGLLQQLPRSAPASGVQMSTAQLSQPRDGWTAACPARASTAVPEDGRCANPVLEWPGRCPGPGPGRWLGPTSGRPERPIAVNAVH